MQRYLRRFFILHLSLMVFSLGLAITIRANIGYSPWEIFHDGIAKNVGLSIGTISIIVGVILAVIVRVCGEQLGMGTVFNVVLVGTYINIILGAEFIPIAQNLAWGTLMMIIGMYIIAIGAYFYIDAGFGAGPRDTLMILLTRATKLPIGVCRSGIEFAVAMAGWAFGGMVGLGSIIFVLGTGFCTQTTFRFFRFDPTKVEHENFRDSWVKIKELLGSHPS